uniref:Uncharacterized protein n=1 Tax=Glossina austeni TaxID=7395 RepID=A0A1A9UE98_GLOAU
MSQQNDRHFIHNTNCIWTACQNLSIMPLILTQLRYNGDPIINVWFSLSALLCDCGTCHTRLVTPINYGYVEKNQTNKKTPFWGMTKSGLPSGPHHQMNRCHRLPFVFGGPFFDILISTGISFLIDSEVCCFSYSTASLMKTSWEGVNFQLPETVLRRSISATISTAPPRTNIIRTLSSIFHASFVAILLNCDLNIVEVGRKTWAYIYGFLLPPLMSECTLLALAASDILLILIT